MMLKITFVQYAWTITDAKHAVTPLVNAQPVPLAISWMLPPKLVPHAQKDVRPVHPKALALQMPVYQVIGTMRQSKPAPIAELSALPAILRQKDAIPARLILAWIRTLGSVMRCSQGVQTVRILKYALLVRVVSGWMIQLSCVIHALQVNFYFLKNDLKLGKF